MPEFIFVAKDNNGKVVTEQLDTISRYEAIAQVKARGLTLTSLKVAKTKKIKREAVAPSTPRKGFSLFPSRVSVSELAIFCRQLSLMFSSGIDLINGLEALGEDIDNPYFKGVLFKITTDIRNGEHFSEAIAKHEKVFNALLVALIRSAEEAGSMEQVLAYLSQYLEKLDRLIRKIKNISTYPIFVVVFFIIVVFIITLFVIPRFESIFSGFGAQLPAFTRVVFGINRFFISHLAFFLMITGGAACAFIVYQTSPVGRYNTDQLKLRLPIIGKLFRKTVIARFCRILAMMIRGGVSIGIAIEITGKACGNKVIERSVDRLRNQIISGSEISKGLSQDNNFPRLMVRMVGIGESSGKLPEVLDKVADIYEDQVDSTIMTATSLFEPIAIIIFGGVILVLILAVYIPVFKFAMSVRG